MKRLAQLILIFLALAIPHVASTEEQEGLLNRLLAPGPLIHGHKDLEGGDCLKCHDAGKGISAAKCLDCHKDIRKPVESKTGYHGMQTKTCIECHSDHKGRSFDSTKLDTSSFDHALTGYKLEGKHHDLKCKECHTETRTKKPIRPKDVRYFGAATSCVSCHKKHDPHFFKGDWAKKDCNACHGLKSWKEQLRFDHEKDARYRLEGKHAQTKCSECHVPDQKNPDLRAKTARYQWSNLKEAQCLSCHTDTHKGNMSPRFSGGRCTDCHTQTTWKLERFDHQVTRYPLRGKHSELKCEECHKQTPKVLTEGPKHFMWKGLKTDCLSCHKDFHAFGPHKAAKLGSLNDCLTCHDESSWKKIHGFNHDTQTRFAIDGKHEGLECLKCHTSLDKKFANLPLKQRPTVYHWAQLGEKTCEVCHESPHKNSFRREFLAKKCTECHVSEGWKVFNRKGAKFDHSQTRFALTGSHEKLTCAECHTRDKKQVFRFESSAQKFCVDCHEGPHNKQFSSKFGHNSCTECHTTGKWNERLEFNHKQTRFNLTGAHSQLNCEECHKPTSEFFPPLLPNQSPHAKSKFLFPEMQNEKSCTACHSDFHKGQLGNNCLQCHTDQSWKPVQFNHNKQSRYILRDKHMTLKCEDCHKPTREAVQYPSRQGPVTRAHITYKPMATECGACHKDPHKGSFGANCQECHGEKGWKTTKDFHKGFTLSGIHYSLQCGECHRDTRKLTGMSSQCSACHQKDDVHGGTLPNCGECHRQQFWEQTQFKHSMSRFPLRGIHRTLDCNACHSRGVYQGAPNRCVDCHLNDAKAASTHPNPIPAFQDCARCHNQFSFN